MESDLCFTNYSLLLVSSSVAHLHVHDLLTVPGEGLFQTQYTRQAWCTFHFLLLWNVENGSCFTNYSLFLVSSSVAHLHVHDLLTVPGEGLFQTQYTRQAWCTFHFLLLWNVENGSCFTNYSLFLVSSSVAHLHVHDLLTVPGEGTFPSPKKSSTYWTSWWANSPCRLRTLIWPSSLTSCKWDTEDFDLAKLFDIL